MILLSVKQSLVIIVICDQIILLAALLWGLCYEVFVMMSLLCCYACFYLVLFSFPFLYCAYMSFFKMLHDRLGTDKTWGKQTLKQIPDKSDWVTEIIKPCNIIHFMMTLLTIRKIWMCVCVWSGNLIGRTSSERNYKGTGRAWASNYNIWYHESENS